MAAVVPARVCRNALSRCVAACVTMLGLAGCGASPAPVMESSGRAHHVDPTGMRVMSLVRPTPDVVRVSLWIDAGSRDAEPPQLATVSAWSAAIAAGPDVQARALPDAIELWVECGADDVGSAVEHLARGLASRDVSESVLATLRARLIDQRARHALGGVEPASKAALTAALGDEQAAAFFPLGAAEDDDDISTDRVATYLSDHFGPNRAALVAVGDVRASLLSAAIGAHVTPVPQARATRATRTLELSADPTAARVAITRKGAAAVAVVSHDHNLVRSTLSALQQRWAAYPTSVRWTPVRGGAIGVAVTPSAEPVSAIRVALDTTQTASAITAAPHEDLAALSERAGLELAAPALMHASAAVRLGVGVTLAESARSGPEAESRDQGRVEATQRDLERVFEDAVRTPSYRGEIGAQAAHIVLSNGARIVAQRRQSELVGIAITFLGGAAEEHATNHGRTALLALLSAQGCEGIGPGALNARLRTLGATLTPMLEAGSFGLRMSSPRAHWRASLELITQCALRPLLNRRVLRDAQARMLASLSERSAQGRAAQLARVLSPTHPGAIARWGSIDSALLDLDVIVRAHTQAAVGARLALAVVGDIPIAEAVHLAAARLSRQPAGALPQALTPRTTAAAVSSTAHAGPTPLALVAFHIAHADADPVGARVFAALLGEAMTQTPAITMSWLDAGVFPSGAWAGVGLSLPLETLEQLNEVVDKALHTLASPDGRARARTLTERAIRHDASARSEPVHEAVWRANQALHGVQPETTTDRAAHTFDTFVRARPHYLLSRGNAARVSNDAAASRP